MSNRDRFNISELDSGFMVTTHGDEGTKDAAFSTLDEVIKSVKAYFGHEDELEKQKAIIAKQMASVEAKVHAERYGFDMRPSEKGIDVWFEWRGHEDVDTMYCEPPSHINRYDFVEVILRNEVRKKDVAGDLTWRHYGTDGDILFYRMTPTLDR